MRYMPDLSNYLYDSFLSKYGIILKFFFLWIVIETHASLESNVSNCCSLCEDKFLFLHPNTQQLVSL